MQTTQKGTTHFPTLFSTLRLKNKELKNRISLAPMTRTSASENGIPTEDMARYYARFARGGFSLLVTEGIYPDEKHSQGYKFQPGLANTAHMEGWWKVVNAVHQEGAVIIAQLMHAGALSQGSYYTKETIGPSAVKPKGEQLGVYQGAGEYKVPREMTKEDIQEVIRSFVNAAENARQAGFDGVEVHGANGYLLDQFLTDYANQRTDEYGGSTENRVRMTSEVIAAIREKVGPDFIVGVRISQGKVNDYEHKWAGKEKDAEIIFSRLKQAGSDYIHVTEYDAAAPAFEGSDATLTGLAKKFGQTVVIANGSLGDPEKAESLLKEGAADMIALGKPALANRDWPEKVAQGEALNSFDYGVLQPLANLKQQEL